MRTYTIALLSDFRKSELSGSCTKLSMGLGSLGYAVNGKMSAELSHTSQSVSKRPVENAVSPSVCCTDNQCKMKQSKSHVSHLQVTSKCSMKRCDLVPLTYHRYQSDEASLSRNPNPSPWLSRGLVTVERCAQGMLRRAMIGEPTEEHC